MGIFNEDIYVNGSLGAKTFLPSAGAILDAHINAAAGIQTSKMVHKYRKHYNQNGGAVSATIPIHVLQSATGGTIASFKVGSVAATTGSSTVTVDLKKNGSSILTAAIQLDSVTNKTARTLYAGSLNSTTGIQGDWYDIVVTATQGTGSLPSGLCLPKRTSATA